MCTTGQICCINIAGTGPSMFACAGADATCNGGARVCDGPEDCTGGACCIVGAHNTICLQGTSCTLLACHSDGDCSSSTRCCHGECNSTTMPCN
jgi:hypothetical protein